MEGVPRPWQGLGLQVLLHQLWWTLQTAGKAVANAWAICQGVTIEESRAVAPLFAAETHSVTVGYTGGLTAQTGSQGIAGQVGPATVNLLRLRGQ
jgi:hypothetical protein